MCSELVLAPCPRLQATEKAGEPRGRLPSRQHHHLICVFSSRYVTSHNKTEVWWQTGISNKRKADNRTALLISNVTCPLLVVQIKRTTLVAMFSRGRQER